MAIEYNHYGQPQYETSVASVIASYLGLRVIFNTTMTKDAALSEATYYTITNVTPVAATCNVLSVTPEDVANPNYVDLEVSDLTDGATYLLTITQSVIKNSSDNFLIGGNAIQYTGVSLAPVINSITTLSNTSIEVQFNKSMRLSDISDPSKYSFDKGLSVLSVTVISSSVVRLTTTSQTPSEFYTLTVS
jgi:hypothetical protein